METLKGKIIFIEDDFKYTGVIVPRKGNTSHTVTNLENISISDYQVRFKVMPYTTSQGNVSYDVDMLKDDIGLKYSGKYKELLNYYDEGEEEGEVDCKVYKNESGYLLFGGWSEGGFYTWIGVIEKG